MIRSIIIEDEPLAAEHLQRSLAAIGGIAVLHVFEQPAKAFEYANTQHIDLIFLDIHLGQENGLKQLKSTVKPPPVIVISANSQYALQGFDLDVCDYLLKPFTQQRLEKAIEKYKASLHPGNGSASHFMIKTDTRMEAVYYRDLICIEGMGDYRRIVTQQRKIMTLQTFKEMEESLDAHWVQRIHKSYMVQLRSIVEFTSTRVTLTNGQQLPVSETYRKLLKDRLSR